MFRTKKAQAAMEFLMTYGWAILVVLAAIAALAYFGVLSPDRFLPEQCTLPSGAACLDFTASTSEIELIIQNSAGFDMTSVSVYLNSSALNGNMACTGGAELQDGSKDNFICAANLTAGKYKGDLTISYVNAQTQLAHVKVGTLIAEIS